MNNTVEIQTLNDRLAELGLELGEPVRQSRKIEVTPERIWSAISKSGNLTSYHPFVKANPVDSWTGVGSRDQVIYYSGLVYQREFVTWLDGVGYDLELGPNPPDKTARVSWRIKALTNTHTELSLEVTPYLKIGMPAIQRKAYLEFAFGDALVSYLESVVRGVDLFVTSGQTIIKNQFGSHPIYSPE